MPAQPDPVTVLEAVDMKANNLETIGGNAIHVTHWGTTGPRVVMVHGSAQGSAVGGTRHFSAQARLGDRGWRVIVPDRPGHGQSPAPDRPDDPELDGRWVAELLGDGAHLVGHSFGGAVALAAAARRPSAVRSLTLIEPALQKVAVDLAPVRRFGLQVLASKIFSLSMASRARKFSALIRIPDDIRGGRSQEELTRMGQGIMALRLPTREEIQRNFKIIRDAQIPLLVVSGGWSPALEAVADRAAQLGGGKRLVIESPHHFPQLVSEEFNMALAGFMRAADGIERPLAPSKP
jgi:pimeloyl-ACP methyl ester carboxylesterase